MKTTDLCAGLFAIACGLFAMSAGAEDWRQFRGND